MVKREGFAKALKWPTKSVRSCFAQYQHSLCSCSQFSPFKLFLQINLFIYLIPPLLLSSIFHCDFPPLNLSSVEEVCHDKDQKPRGRGGERGRSEGCRKILRKKNNQNGEREESSALKRVDNKNNSRDTAKGPIFS